MELKTETYERLELLGDRVIKLLVTHYLFERYPKKNEGFMTELQIKIEDKRNLAMLGKEFGFSKFLIISKQIEMKYGRNLEQILEDTFEAFMGALFLSNGFEICLLFMINILETMIDYSEKLYNDINYKTLLMTHFHTKGWSSPKYETIYEEGSGGPDKSYLVGVVIDGIKSTVPKEKRYCGFGVGNSKKIGQKKAAKMALIKLGVLNEDQYNHSDIYYPDWDNLGKEKSEEKIQETSDIDGDEF